MATRTGSGIQTYGSKTIGFKSTNLLIREVKLGVAILLNISTAHSTAKSFCSRESIKNELRERGRYKEIRLQDPSARRKGQGLVDNTHFLLERARCIATIHGRLPKVSHQFTSISLLLGSNYSRELHPAYFLMPRQLGRYDLSLCLTDNDDQISIDNATSLSHVCSSFSVVTTCCINFGQVFTNLN